MIETFQEFKETKNIDRTTLVSVLEESFRNVIAKMFGSDENYDVIVNPDKGDFEIHRNRIVVADGDVKDENKEIALSEAQKIEPDYEVGEEVSEEVEFAKFGRRAILNLRQTLASKILELEHDSLYQKYKDKVGQIVAAEVYQMWKREVLLIDDEGNELHLPKQEQIPADNYHKGETIRAIVKEVQNENNNPRIILSRTSSQFLERLLEAEVPEIQDGLITIRRIARMPGERAKVAVESYDDRIDPVGACVGVKGSRVHGIVREMCNENSYVNKAVNDTIAEILSDKDFDITTIDDILNNEILERMVCGVIKYYIYEKLMGQDTLGVIKRETDPAKIKKFEKTMRDCIDGLVTGFVPSVLKEGLEKKEINTLVDELYEISYQAMEGMKL